MRSITRGTRCSVALLGWLAACGAQAHTQAPIALRGPGPFHKLELPLAIHGRAAFGDLRDLRVRNASGQTVPWGWLDDPQATSAATTTTVRASLFALEPARPDSTAPTPVPARGDADEWVIDTGEMEGERVRARFELAPGPSGLFPFALDASDDLRRWRGIDAEGQIARLQRGPARIERSSVELGPVEARFLRLRWKHPERAPRLAAAWIDIAQRTVEPLAWTADIGPSACGFDACDYPVPRGLPVRSLRISLNQSNTLAPLRVLDVDRPAEETLLAEATVFRLDRSSEETRSGAIALDGRSHAVLRLRTQGAIAALGTRPPTLSYGARPPTLVFLAQGRPPFTLSWNEDSRTALPMPHALPLRQLIPGGWRSRAPKIDPASATFEDPVDEPSETGPSAAASAANPSDETATIRSGRTFPETHPWSALAIVAVLLAAMVWSLLRAIGSTPRAWMSSSRSLTPQVDDRHRVAAIEARRPARRRRTYP